LSGGQTLEVLSSCCNKEPLSAAPFLALSDLT
jgi:hypothetical protein